MIASQGAESLKLHYTMNSLTRRGVHMGAAGRFSGDGNVTKVLNVIASRVMSKNIFRYMYIKWLSHKFLW